MPRYAINKRVNGPKLLDELIAAIPALAPRGEEPQVRVHVPSDGMNGYILTIPNISAAEIQAVVDAHNPDAPRPGRPDAELTAADRAWLADNQADLPDWRRAKKVFRFILRRIE
jgi:hypothetical protein